MHDCFMDAQPEAPIPVNSDSVLIHDIELKNLALFLDMSWDSPDVTYGNISKYDVRVTIFPESEQNSAVDFATVYREEFPVCVNYSY